MKLKAVAIGLGAIVLLAAGGVFGLGFYASQHAEERAALVLEQLPPGVGATHGKASCGWFCDPLVIEDVALTVNLPWAKDIHLGRMTVSGMNSGGVEHAAAASTRRRRRPLDGARPRRR